VLVRTTRRMMENPVFQSVPTGVAWMVLLGVCAICLLLLNRRLRAREVVR
jgi:hypothetical protein